jgi:hypothetical protein
MGNKALTFFDPRLAGKFTDPAMGTMLAGLGLGYGAKKYFEDEGPQPGRSIAQGYIPRGLI